MLLEMDRMKELISKSNHILYFKHYKKKGWIFEYQGVRLFVKIKNKFIELRAEFNPIYNKLGSFVEYKYEYNMKMTLISIIDYKIEDTGLKLFFDRLSFILYDGIEDFKVKKIYT